MCHDIPSAKLDSGSPVSKARVMQRLGTRQSLSPHRQEAAMDNTLWSSTLATVACLAAIGLGAQSPATPSPTGSNRTMTVTGCIELTEQSVVGTSGSFGSLTPAVPDTTFILTRATAATRPPAGAPTVATPTGPATYRIDIADEGKLWLHVGHKVEITGTVGTAAAGTFPKLQVQSVKLVA